MLTIRTHTRFVTMSSYEEYVQYDNLNSFYCFIVQSKPYKTKVSVSPSAEARFSFTN